MCNNRCESDCINLRATMGANIIHKWTHKLLFVFSAVTTIENRSSPGRMKCQLSRHGDQSRVVHESRTEREEHQFFNHLMCVSARSAI